MWPWRGLAGWLARCVTPWPAARAAPPAVGFHSAPASPAPAAPPANRQNFKGAAGGAIFRAYPGPYQVDLRRACCGPEAGSLRAPAACRPLRCPCHALAPPASQRPLPGPAPAADCSARPAAPPSTCLQPAQIYSRTREGFSLVEERPEMPSLREVSLEVLPRAAAKLARANR